MSSFAEQLAARAAKRTSGESSDPISSPSKRSGENNLKNHSSSSIGSSPSRTVTSLSEQIKSRAVERNNSGRSSNNDDRAELTTDEKLKSSKSSSSSSSRSKRTNEASSTDSSVSKAAAKVSPSSQQQRRQADDLDILFNETDTIDDSVTSSYIPAKLRPMKSDSPQTTPNIESSSEHQQQSSSSSSKLKAKLDKYKSENKKLRHESLLLKAKIEEMATLLTQLQQLESTHKGENEKLKTRVEELTEKILALEMDQLNDAGGGGGGGGGAKSEVMDGDYEWNGIRSSLMKLRQERNKQQRRRDSMATSNNSNEGRSSMLSLDTFAELEKEDLLAENVRLTQLVLDIEGLAELQKLVDATQNSRGGDNNGGNGDGGKNVNDNDEKDAAISALNKKVAQIEEELREVTELKNAEIEVLRKQLNRAEQQQHNRHNSKDSFTPQDAAMNMEQQQQQWNKEREELREEIRRLNHEVSRQMSNRLDQEEEEDNARYNGTSSSSSTSLFITSPKNLDNSDISSLQSIIGMMRQTIDQSNKEKEELEQRLAEEQERSQNELKAFAKTLEGVDDLRKSAETMSREIRRIKVKGYRPTRSDLMGGGGDLNGVRNFGELTAAVEASESMEDAIRLIEGQNDAMGERRGMGVVAASQSFGGGGSGAPAAPIARKGSSGLRAISEDEDDKEGGFLSFWNGAGRTNDDEEDDDDVIAKREKKKKSKRKKKRDDEGSVFTSFF
eukprot:scaffold855_cov140-Skeletonema_menzelii.AAC.18